MRSPRALAALAALGLATGVGQLESAQATIVLADGDRITGAVALTAPPLPSSPSASRELAIEVAGASRQVPLDRIVMIDFTDGRPGTGELAAIPAAGHLLSLRNGDLRPGRLVELTGSQTLVWDLAEGARIDVPIEQVRRVFLQGSRARGLLDADSAGTGAMRVGAGLPRKTIKVRASLPWTDTGIQVQRGDRLRFQTASRVFFSGQKETSATAEGNPSHFDEGFPVPNAPAGALIAKVGEGGVPFAVITESPRVRMPATGQLFLGVNDTEFADNAGGFHVRVKR